MSLVFNTEKTVFFASDGTGAAANAGGCTKVWWDTECPNQTEAEHVAARDKMMDVNGTPIVNVDSISYTEADDKYNITGIEALGVEVGMLVYVFNATYISTGLYKITEVGTNYIKASGSDQPNNDTVEVIVGGEFLLQAALDETSANNNSVEIHVRDGITLLSAIDLDFGGGSLTYGTFKRIRGYNTSPGDMDPDGTYYQSSYEILGDSIDNTKAVLLDGDGLNLSIFNVMVGNVIIENFHCYNTGTADSLNFVSIPENIVFRNCRFSNGNFVYSTIANSVLIDNCYSHSNLTGNHYQTMGNENVILNCIGIVAATKIFVVVATVQGTTVTGCIIIDGARGIRVFGYDITAINNTFYNQTSYGIDVTGARGIIAYNNIFDLYPGAIAFNIAIGAMLYNDYNCFIESDGTPLTVGSHGSGYEIPLIGSHSIEVDPQFMDAGNYDFRLKPTSPCLNSGKPTVGEGYMDMGAWNRISRIRR